MKRILTPVLALLGLLLFACEEPGGGLDQPQESQGVSPEPTSAAPAQEEPQMEQTETTEPSAGEEPTQ